MQNGVGDQGGVRMEKIDPGTVVVSKILIFKSIFKLVLGTKFWVVSKIFAKQI